MLHPGAVEIPTPKFSYNGRGASRTKSRFQRGNNPNSKKRSKTMLFTTDLKTKAEKYLEKPIETNTFFVLDVLVQKDKDAVVLIAPIDTSTDPYFNAAYQGKSHWFGGLEHMLNYCVEKGYMKASAINKLKERYETEQPIHYKEERHGWKNRRV